MGVTVHACIHMLAHACCCIFFMCVKHNRNFEVKICALLAKMAGMWIKKSIFAVKIPLIAPTYIFFGGGGGADLYICPPPPRFLYSGSYAYSYTVSTKRAPLCAYICIARCSSNWIKGSHTHALHSPTNIPLLKTNH